ncbi:MAG: hypothetical protein MI810_03495 [Flavobacteriales bacterium]|nr:hypothetical protein [Flavobacteriales bacterium]
MKKSPSLQIVSILLFGVAVFLISYKLTNGIFLTEVFENGLSYKVTYEFDYKKGEKDSTFYIKAFLPQDNSRQHIKDVQHQSGTASFSKEQFSSNEMGLWNGEIFDQKEQIRYSFRADVKPVRYDIGAGLLLADVQNSQSEFVQPSTFIESNDPRIEKLAFDLTATDKKADAVLSSLFNYVYEIPAQSTKELMTAVEALEINAASCNGKSRLFVALCRNLNLPARVVGGIILNEEKKKTSHLWAEVLIENEWVAFDPLNGYYAYLPANYLEVYKGDEFLVKRSSDMLFDYNYNVELIEQEVGFVEQLNMFTIAGKTGMSAKILSLMLLLPLGSLIVAIFRNVIGLRTFGVFLPVLIAISFISTGLVFGVISFVAVLLFVSLMHYPLMKWGILHVPKLVAMLAAVVFVMILVLVSGVQLNMGDMVNLTFFPIVILTISAEKYARIVVEDGFVNASKILFQTLIVTLFCYIVVGSEMINLIVMNFPEVLLLVALTSLMLGKWIGLRISEYRRFGWILS